MPQTTLTNATEEVPNEIIVYKKLSKSLNEIEHKVPGNDRPPSRFNEAEDIEEQGSIRRYHKHGLFYWTPKRF
jgi:hypothetical protein